MDEKYLTVLDFCRLAKCSTPTVYRMVEEKSIRFDRRQIGRRKDVLVIPETELKKFKL